MLHRAALSVSRFPRGGASASARLAFASLGWSLASKGNPTGIVFRWNPLSNGTHCQSSPVLGGAARVSHGPCTLSRRCRCCSRRAL